MAKVAMSGRFECQDGKSDEMDAAVAAQTEALTSDTNVEVYAYSRGQENQYTFFALFPSWEAMQNHGQGAEMQEAMETFKSLLAGPPDVVMAELVAAKGFGT
ncbi:MAG: hypothetical protein GY724_21755 [Actinomycetia bacterium]|nr:hypothetical protein [Actinomycetes bacterium]MCP5035639.1 hypothetical protein [Actinomycetes bacterium]